MSLRKENQGKSKRRFGTTIRSRLLIGFVLMALLPAIGISAGSIGVGYYNGQQQALQRLESVAALKESEIRAWIDNVQGELVTALNEEYALERARVVLVLAEDDWGSEIINKALRKRLQGFVDQSQQLEEIFLLDLEGQVVLSTDITQEGKGYGDQAFFQEGMIGPHAQLLVYPNPEEASVPEKRDTNGNGMEPEGRMSMITAIPVVSPAGQLWGVLANRVGLEELDGILRDRTGLGSTGQSYLASSNYILLTEASGHDSESAAGYAHSTGIDAALENQVSGSGVYDDYRGVRVVGVYRWLPELQMALLAEQGVAEAFRAIVTTLVVNLSIALISVALAVGASLVITRGIAAPLINLVETAAHIAAGDIERVAKVEREDEVGVLARTFNSMTTQLRDLIDNLEQRVKDRTDDLRQRALQLETSAQVSREVTSILDIDDLLARVVALIRSAFGYYHVHVFLVDKEADQLVLRASTGELDPQLRRLEIGEGSLNGETAKTNQALLVNDVIQDPRYLPAASLPYTRSELVIPLRVSDQVIGTLDVQSAEMNAFTREDVVVIQSLGDQIAIAIENARLYKQSRELVILEERNRLSRELHDSVIQSLYSLTLFAESGRELVKAGDLTSLAGHQTRMGETAHQVLKEMRLLVYELRPLALEQEGLLGALHQRLDAVERRAGVEARLLVDELVDLPVLIEEELYRIAVEALNNALKHAGATSVMVHIRSDGASVELEVADDGRGFDPEAVSGLGGMGLTSMQERAEKLGGKLQVISTKGEGTRVIARVRRDGRQLDG